ncbi:hypothetical protein [Diaphorobacter caeni]|uniref:hypothetical protein n=1 Tax=Diaphorobacter caeni TaxID=2784387 RepID=UPI00188EFF03|nr:hypothetical protein [Diaphorobacter caeni]MBF5007613.1 hypothetical protein [Diaphorobacter caeni]
MKSVLWVVEVRKDKTREWHWQVAKDSREMARRQAKFWRGLKHETRVVKYVRAA